MKNLLFIRLCSFFIPLAILGSLIFMLTAKRPVIVESVESVADKIYYYTDYAVTLDYIKRKESQGASEKTLRTPGPNGELGSYQMTPIYIKDHLRRTGERLDPLNDLQAEASVCLYLEYYCPLVGAESIEDAYQVYRRGAKGYKKFRGRHESE
ncbi:MAG: hypothetical protein GY845_25830 [Planctomycetes bacterium]|nr:hypothetical protein [Planctomycetota bacterium]